MKVLIRFLVTDLLDPPFDTHLTLQIRPPESHGRHRVGQQLLALGALVVGEEHEALLIEALEQQGTQMRLAVAVHRGQHHGVGFGGFHLHRLTEPQPEQAVRVIRCLAFDQSVAGVVAAHIGDAVFHGAGS